MSRRPRHAGDDGSFGRSAGMAAGRGAVLLAVAVVLGIILLNVADDAPEQVSAGDAGTTTTTSDTTESTAVSTTIATLPLRQPAEVKVLAGNGTDVKGVARKATDQLKAAGYNVLAPTDATKTATSAVYYVGEYSREAEGVAGILGLAPTAVAPFPTPAPLPDGRGANVVVVVGADLAAQLQGTSSTTAGATTTTTRAAATTTTSKP